MANCNKDGWIRCKKCGHKLARVIASGNDTVIEFKCTSCKEINTWYIPYDDFDAINEEGMRNANEDVYKEVRS